MTLSPEQILEALAACGVRIDGTDAAVRYFQEKGLSPESLLNLAAQGRQHGVTFTRSGLHGAASAARLLESWGMTAEQVALFGHNTWPAMSGHHPGSEQGPGMPKLDAQLPPGVMIDPVHYPFPNTAKPIHLRSCEAGKLGLFEGRSYNDELFNTPTKWWVVVLESDSGEARHWLYADASAAGAAVERWDGNGEPPSFSWAPHLIAPAA